MWGGKPEKAIPKSSGGAIGWSKDTQSGTKQPLGDEGTNFRSNLGRPSPLHIPTDDDDDDDDLARLIQGFFFWFEGI